MSLINRFRHQRRLQWGAWNNRRVVPVGMQGRAVDAIRMAREHSDKGNYCESTFDTESPESFGLRHVGDVTPEFRYWDSLWRRNDQIGWTTEPHGDYFRDGTGLVWGVVYQLPARNGRSRYVPGFQFGGVDGGPTLDFSSIHESADGGPDSKAARDAARDADEQARIAAEREREYQSAWQAGAMWRDKGDQLDSIRSRLLVKLDSRRSAKADLQAAGLVPSVTWDSLCDMVREHVRGQLESMAELRRERAELAAGDGSEYLSFWPWDERLRAAFCDGAGLDRFPG